MRDAVRRMGSLSLYHWATYGRSRIEVEGDNENVSVTEEGSNDSAHLVTVALVLSGMVVHPPRLSPL